MQAENVTVMEGGTAEISCRLQNYDGSIVVIQNPRRQTLFFNGTRGVYVPLVSADRPDLSASVHSPSAASESSLFNTLAMTHRRIFSHRKCPHFAFEAIPH